MNPKLILKALTKKERIVFIAATGVFIAGFFANAAIAFREKTVLAPIEGGSYREAVIGQPVAINPVISRNSADLDLSALIYNSINDLVENISAKDENRSVNIKIREDLVWSNGRPLTSDDIVFTVKTIQDPETKSPIFGIWQGVIAERISELQVKFSLPAPYSFFTDNLKLTPVIPKHIFGVIPPANFHLSSYNLEPIGSGPYKLKKIFKRKDGFISEYRLTVNERHHQASPFLKNISIIFFENEKDALLALKERRIDGFGSATPLSSSSQIPERMTVKEIPMSRYYAVFFNQNVSPTLKNLSVRSALRDIIDKKRIINEVFGGKLAKSIESPIIELEDIVPLKPDTKAASAAIANFKKNNGDFSLNLIVPKIDFLVKTAEIIKQEWETAGVSEVNIISLSPEDIFENVIKTNNYEMVLFGNVLEKPKDLFSFWHSSERFYPGHNLALYKNQKADGLIEKIRQSGDRKEQMDLLYDLKTTIVKDAPAAFLYALSYIYVHDPKLQGFKTEETVSSPSDRFQYTSRWFVETARIIKEKASSTDITAK